MLRGMMMDRPLLVSSVIDYAAEIFPDVQVVSQTVEGGLHRYGYAQARERIGRLANALVGSASSLATAWRRWPGTATAISSSTTPSPASAPSATPSTRACSPSRSPTSPITPRTRALFFDLTFLPLVEKLARCQVDQDLRGDDRSRAHAARGAAAGSAVLRGPARRSAGRHHLAGIRRERRLRALLHVGHDRRAEGRALLQPLDAAAHVLR